MVDSENKDRSHVAFSGRLDSRKFAFTNRVGDKWNSFCDLCQVKSHISIRLEPETRM